MIRNMASRAGAYWIIDEIALAQRYEEIEPFRAWRVTVKGRRFPAKTAPATQYARSPLSSPDFPEPGITLYWNAVILLPGEC